VRNTDARVIKCYSGLVYTPVVVTVLSIRGYFSLRQRMSQRDVMCHIHGIRKRSSAVNTHCEGTSVGPATCRGDNIHALFHGM
jgi:hypothetical protein